MDFDGEKLTEEEVIGLEIFTKKEAREYVKKKLKIGNTYYYQFVAPELRDKFAPLLANLDTVKFGIPCIFKRDLDKYIHYKKGVRLLRRKM